ncbi:hypothetical protein FB45DRAFT_1039954 [Roridomyces roridus]|uniref:Uncharacterized protein n=1 Tax=Roridomyces roridus TaxID=1738132 RepID=A0AAD7F9Z9_9AGAR|nr:hypothetical protein FB45DRAFT_1039954 [Roridomyces roridus]
MSLRARNRNISSYTQCHPTPCRQRGNFFMRFLRGSFLAHMRRFGLVVEDSPLASTPVTAHIRSLVDVLRERGINVDHPAETALLAHEGMPLIPLYVGNRGVARPSDNQIRLCRSPLPPQSTLADMAASRLRFAIPGLCIETVDGESYFCIQWVMSQEFLSATFTLPGIGQEARLHHCLPRRINLVFPRDREFVPWPHEDGASSCDGGDVANLSDLDDEEMDVVAVGGPSLYVAARGASNTPLRVMYSGDTLAEAADELLAAIGRCVDANDFTDVLSEDQNAILYYPRTPEERDSGDGVVRSLGEGVLRDVYQEAFSKVMAGSSRWLTPRFDGKLSLLCVLSLGFGDHYLSAGRQHDIAALLSIPSMFACCNFCSTDGDLRALHPGFIGEWHPALRAIISAWKTAGPAGNVNKPAIVGHLASYMDLPIQAIENRDQRMHDALAVEMVYKAVVASQGPRHKDMEWLLRGFRLTCRNGFQFPKFVRNTSGGSEAFLTKVMASLVGPYSLIPRLVFPPSPLAGPIVEAMGGETLADLFQDYLEQTGVPCPALFEACKPHFTESADLTRVDSPNFRAQMLTWAVTGQPFLPAGSSGISIMLVDDDDPVYLGGHDTEMRRALVDSGTISYRTCFQQARIPASFLLRAAQAAYTGVEPASRRKFLHHWLLCQSLGAIGDTHTFT